MVWVRPAEQSRLRACVSLMAVISLAGCVGVPRESGALGSQSTVEPGATPTPTTGQPPTPTPTLAPTLAPTPVPTLAPGSTPPPTRLNGSTPSVSAARFDGTWRVHFAVTKTPGGGAALKKGGTWSDTWTITPNCASGACGAEIDGGLGPPGFTYHSFILELTRSGATYTGSVKEKITTCGGNPPVGVMVKNTVSVEIKVTKGAFRGDAWVATAWSGTLVLASPYKRNGIWYCPAQQWKMSLESSPA